MSGETTPAGLADLLAESGIFPAKAARSLGRLYRELLDQVARQRAAEAALQGMLAMRDPVQFFGSAGFSTADFVAQAVGMGDALIAELEATRAAKT